MNIRDDEPGHFTKPSQNGSCLGSCLFFMDFQEGMSSGVTPESTKRVRGGDASIVVENWNFLHLHWNVLMLSYVSWHFCEGVDMTFFPKNVYTRTIYLIFSWWFFFSGGRKRWCDSFVENTKTTDMAFLRNIFPNNKSDEFCIFLENKNTI